MPRVNGDPKYKSHIKCSGFRKPTEEPLEDSGVELSIGSDFLEILQFQGHLSDYKIIVFDG